MGRSAALFLLATLTLLFSGFFDSGTPVSADASPVRSAASLPSSVKPRMRLPLVAADKNYTALPGTFTPTSPVIHGVNAIPTAVAPSDSNGSVGFQDTVADLSVVVHVVDADGTPIPNVQVRVAVSDGNVAAFPADTIEWIGFTAASTRGSVSASAFPTEKTLDVVLKLYKAFALGQKAGRASIDVPALLGATTSGIEVCVTPDQLVTQLQLVSGIAFAAFGLIASPTVVGSIVLLGAGMAVDEIIKELVLSNVKDRVHARVHILSFDPRNPFLLAAPVPVVEVLPNNPDCPKSAPIVAKPKAPFLADVIAKSSTEVVVSWSDQSDNEDGFVVQLDGNRGLSEALPTYRAPKNSTSFTASGLQPETQYCAFVYAYNSAGGSLANVATFKCATTLAAIPPASPFVTSVEAAGPGSVRVSWQDRSTDETEFVVTEGETAVGRTPANTTSIVLPGLVPESRHCYRVQAMNEYGLSQPSAESCGEAGAGTRSVSVTEEFSGGTCLAVITQIPITLVATGYSMTLPLIRTSSCPGGSVTFPNVPVGTYSLTAGNCSLVLSADQVDVTSCLAAQGGTVAAPTEVLVLDLGPCSGVTDCLAYRAVWGYTGSPPSSFVIHGIYCGGIAGVCLAPEVVASVGPAARSWDFQQFLGIFDGFGLACVGVQAVGGGSQSTVAWQPGCPIGGF